LSLRPKGSTTRQSRLQSLQSASGRTWTLEIPSWTSPPLQRQTKDRAVVHLTRQAERIQVDTSLEVCFPYSVFPERGSGMCGRACYDPTACVFRFSQPLDAFIRLEPAGLVSCRCRSWGCTLQSITPPAQQHTVSSIAYPQAVSPTTALSDSKSDPPQST
jgi:hypothetical protein